MEVIIKNTKHHPSCPHGPCLMFERHSANGTKTGRKFYACSACRDRSVCSFFHWCDDEISSKKQEHWNDIIEASKPCFTHDECMSRLSSFKQLPSHERRYCKTCSLLIFPDETNHAKHEVVENITSEKLLQPSTLFSVLQDKKSEAQYFFADKTISFVISLLKKLNFTKVLSIGTPKIHEYLLSKQNEDLGLQSLFLDIDDRYMQFFEPGSFCHYNVFNNHFFEGKSSKKTMKQFLSENEGEKIAILLDPPFGGLVDAISYTLNTINKWWKAKNNTQSSEDIPILWFFPYFLEPRIIKSMPSMEMMDYKVDYANHKKFGSKSGSKGSPVRIFTNIEKSSFELPKKEGYKFCAKCQRWTSKENKHCNKCNKCTTNHGPTYKHCDSCNVCVKDSYTHCKIHNKCAPPMLNIKETEKQCNCSLPDSEGNTLKCYKCFGYGHRKNECPINSKSTKKRKQQKPIEAEHLKPSKAEKIKKKKVV
ncbi:hypothetical protein JTE90_010661 [Oedothorax gibbosus]|uniref:Zinc finger CCHC domain-containing protein 4 n=1 Tax=Oedothorax gibbosus TaxID=931172 RepID=A0AAV6USH7_9ARAC|nr:hypothetical protein JTE90_010661 [Oedothorax gibbosus]